MDTNTKGDMRVAGPDSADVELLDARALSTIVRCLPIGNYRFNEAGRTPPLFGYGQSVGQAEPDLPATRLAVARYAEQQNE